MLRINLSSAARRGRPLGRLLVFCACLTSANACTDPASPGGGGHSAPFLLAGTYDVTTKLETFSYEVASTENDPQCPPGGPVYCVHTDPAGAASLSGSLVIPTDYHPAGPTQPSAGIHADVNGRFCASVTDDGCVVMGAPATWSYGPGSVGMSSEIAPDSGSINIYLLPETGALAFEWATFAGDSLFGKVLWRITNDGIPPMYMGTFVAKRRP